MADYNQPLDAADQETPGPGAQMKVGAKGALSPASTIAMDPTQTSELLQNMQRIVEEREGPLAQFTRGLERASAWGSGGIHGPAQSLALINQQQAKEAQDIFGMRQQMAALRSAAAQQERFEKQKASDLGIGGGGGGAPGGAGAFGTVAGLPQIAREALYGARTPEEYNKLKARYGELAMNPEWSKPHKYVDENNKVQVGPLYVASAAMDPNNPRNKSVVAAANSAQQSTGISPEAIKMVESGGVPGLVSPKGAEGVMQVMPNTQINPGFGVTPARDKSQAELERVGRDYYEAMRKRYGDDTLAAIAYNMGPGKADEWLAKGGNFKDLSKETQDYIGKVNLANAKLRTAQADVARPQPTAARQRLSLPEAESKLESETKGLTRELEETGKETSMQRSATVEAGSTADSRMQYADRLNNLVTSNPKAFGVLANANIASGFATLLQEGIKAGNSGAVGLPGLENFVRQSMSGAKEEDIIAAQKALNIFAKLALDEAKIVLKGQGAVSNMERELVSQSVTSLSSRPEVIKDYLTYTKMRAEYDKQVGDLYSKFEKANPNVSFNQFRLTDEYQAAKNAYAKRVDAYIQSSHLKDMAGAGKAPTAPAPQWKHSDADYEAWKKSRGLK